jgi:AraC-like DNA-binding protein
MEELRLSYRENVIRIYFSAMSYQQPSDIAYSYYLEGFDEDWIEAGNHQSVTYTNLSPGTYMLHVRATTNDGVLSEDSTLRIVITPPFYWNTPANIFYLLLIVAGIFFFVRHLLRKKERKHVAEIRELNVQKEQEIQEINIQKEQEIQEINIQKEQEVHDARIKFMTINDKDQELLKKMETVIEQNFSSSDLSVDYIASEIGVSRSGLFAKMKSLADITPNEMIQIIRLKHAASLLLEGRYRVNEVCYMVGFSSPSYFAKCFQKQYGCTPAKYKG